MKMMFSKALQNIGNFFIVLVVVLFLPFILTIWIIGVIVKAKGDKDYDSRNHA